MDEILVKALQFTGPEPEDTVKLVFQALLGCGHLLGNEAQVTQRLLDEMDGLQPDADEALSEEISNSYIRLNLRSAMRLGVRAQWIARMMLLSEQPSASRGDVCRLISELHEKGLIHAEPDEWLPMIAQEGWLPSHSESYRQLRHPAYRVISRCFLPLLPILASLAEKTENGQRLLLTVDGPCGSGKTTLAAILSRILDAPVVHTDDYVVPHAFKTPERLSMPGGNEDHERLLSEFVLPWLKTGVADPRPYSCRQDRLLPPRHIEGGPIAILEGSYSNMPSIRQHAGLRIFVTAELPERLRRIEAREGKDAIPMFLSRWIPLEDAYLTAFSLPDEGCFLIDGSAPFPLPAGGD